MICNGRTVLSDPQWTRVQERLGQKSIIDYFINDQALMKKSSSVFVDKTDIGSSDHYLAWFELAKAFSRRSRKTKRIVYRWRIDKLHDKTIRSEYQTEVGLHADEYFKT